MQIAIVGLVGSGKTTVFNTLTRGHAETGGFGGMELHVGVVKVPDERLDRLAEIFTPKKIVHADVTYVDLPAPPASTEPSGCGWASSSNARTTCSSASLSRRRARCSAGSSSVPTRPSDEAGGAGRST